MTVLLMLLTALIFILVNRLLHSRRTGRQDRLPDVIPEGVGLAVNHLWVQERGGDRLRIGIDWLLGRISGIPNAILLPERKRTVTDRESSITLRFGRRTLKFASPVAGSVLSLNKRVLQNPRLLVDDPYGSGWLLEIKRDPERDRSGSFLVSRPPQWFRTQLDGIIRFFMTAGGHHEVVTAQDGGVLVEGLLWQYDHEVREKFMTQFATLPEE